MSRWSPLVLPETRAACAAAYRHAAEEPARDRAEFERVLQMAGRKEAVRDLELRRLELEEQRLRRAAAEQGRAEEWEAANASVRDSFDRRRDTYEKLLKERDRLDDPDLVREREWIVATMSAISLAFQAAQLMWVTEDMCRLALDASRDLPPDWTLAESRPWDVGLLVWARPMPDVTVHWRGREVTVPLDGVLWGPGQTKDGHAGCRIVMLTRVENVPPDVGGDAERRSPLVEVGQRVLPLWASAARIFAEHGLDGDEPPLSVLMSVVAATWLLSQEPKVALGSSVWRDPDPNRAGRPPRPTPGVTVIDLRPLRHVVVPAVDDKHPGRVYRHRWLVRGHWRQQPVGPGRVERRRQWIPGYVKGPEGAPLLRTEHVHVWRR